MRVPAIRSCGVALLCALSLAPVRAATLPPADARINDSACTRVPTGPGPDSLLSVPGMPWRILVSSHDRRHFERAGEIQEYDTRLQRLRTLPRRGEPAGLVLRPHGVDIATRDGERRLYVVNHDDDNPNGKHHSILVYALEADALQFRQRLRDPLLSSPNHVSVAPDGDLYVSNDRRDGSSVMELALRMSHANLVHYRAGRGWEVVADGLSFANGVRAEPHRVLAVVSFGNALVRYVRFPDGRLGPREDVLKIPALDSLMPGPDPDSWLTVSHGPLLDFLRHRSDSRHPSGAIVYEVNAGTGAATPFFADDGHRISAVSAALLTDDALYLGQGFDAFLLRCPRRNPAARR